MRNFIIYVLLVALFTNSFGLVKSARNVGRRSLSTANSLTVNITKFTNNGEYVAVSWQTNSPANSEDAIGVYLVTKDLNITQAVADRDPIKFKKTNGTASGSVTFQLLNFRKDYQFGYVKNLTTENGGPVLIFSSSIIPNDVPNQPTQVHLMAGGAPTKFNVQWVTKNAAKPQVLWGISHDALSNIVDANTNTYNRNEILEACGWGKNTSVNDLPPDARTGRKKMKAVLKGWTNPGSIHTATLPELAHSTKYYYKVHDAASTAPIDASPVYSFTTMAEPKSNVTQTILVAADIGTIDADGSSRAPFHQSVNVKGALATTYLMNTLANGPIATLITGDLTYSDGTLSDYQTFLENLKTTATSTPLYTAVGNHEADYFYNSSINSISGVVSNQSYGGECGVPYQKFYQVADLTITKQWWTNDIGPIHFLFLDTELNMTKGSPQYNFAEKDLKSVNRTVTPFLIVNMHRPLYCSFNSEQDKDCLLAAQFREQGWEDMFVQNNVTVVLTGHTHVYARSCPMSNFTCHQSFNLDGSFVPSYPVNLITGWGGPDDHKDPTFQEKPFFKYNPRDKPAGFLKMTINQDQLKIEALPAEYPANSPTGPFTLGASIDTLIFPRPYFTSSSAVSPFSG